MAGAALLLALLVGVFQALGFLCRLAPGDAGSWWLSIAGGAPAITVLKRLNHQLPWDLAGVLAAWRAMSHHWLWGVRDGGAGHCFQRPCVTAFAYLAGWFAMRHGAPRVAGRWLLAALLARHAAGPGAACSALHEDHTLDGLDLLGLGPGAGDGAAGAPAWRGLLL